MGLHDGVEVTSAYMCVQVSTQNNSVKARTHHASVDNLAWRRLIPHVGLVVHALPFHPVLR